MLSVQKAEPDSKMQHVNVQESTENVTFVLCARIHDDSNELRSDSSKFRGFYFHWGDPS